MKRFEFANDVAKQLITIAAAIITVVIAFYEKFFSHDIATFLLVLGVLLLFVLSIVAGVLSIGALANLVERQEWTDWQAAQPPAGTPRQPEFAQLGRSWAQRCAMFQQGIFALALVLFIGVALFDRVSAVARPAATGRLVTSAPAERPVVWTQIHPDRSGTQEWLLARAVIEPGAECPDATIGSRRVPMTSRSYPGDPEFPRAICEVAYPGHEPATIAGVALPTRPRQPERILVLGDTGCRITHYTAQPCNRDADWPFRVVGAAAARLKPQLIIHVGDYHYREKPCADRPGCAQSPHGDNWRTWQTDFFEPARAVLTSAPWVMLRGNHENCARAGAGWLLLLQPEPRRALGAQCAEDTAPYLLHFRNLTLAVFDTAAAEEVHGRAARVTAYREQIHTVASRLRQRGESEEPHEQWLLLHQPPWASYGACKEPGPHACIETDLFRALGAAPGAGGPLGKQVPSEIGTRLRREIESPLDVFRQWFEGKLTASRGGTKDGMTSKPLPSPNIPLVLSGDVHMFQMFFPDAKTLPTQLVAGISGDALESSKTYQDLLAAPMGRSANLFGATGKLWARLDFGFVMLTHSDAGWIATVHDTEGKSRVECALPTRSCRPV